MSEVSGRGPGAGSPYGVRAAGVYDSQWSAIVSIASKIGFSPETLRKRLRRTEVDTDLREGLTSADRSRLKELERENRELRRANEILRKASA